MERRGKTEALAKERRRRHRFARSELTINNEPTTLQGNPPGLPRCIAAPVYTVPFMFVYEPALLMLNGWAE